MTAFSSRIFSFHHRELSVQCLLFDFILCFGNGKLDYYHVVVSAYYKRHNNRCLATYTLSHGTFVAGMQRYFLFF